LAVAQLVELAQLGAQDAAEVMRSFAFHRCCIASKLRNEESPPHAEILS
jgi:hypothetical protein